MDARHGRRGRRGRAGHRRNALPGRGYFYPPPGRAGAAVALVQEQPAQLRPLRSEADRPSPRRPGAPLPAHLTSSPETAPLEQTCPAEGGRTMEQPISRSPSRSLPWLIRRPGRITTGIIAAAVAYLATMKLPDELNLLIPYDGAVAVYLGLFCVLMERASPEDAAEMTRRGEPNNRLVLITVMALSVVSLVGVAAMLNHPPGRPRWEINLHMMASLLAVILSWFLAHIYFGLHYMRLYYDDTVVDGKRTYHLGLEFPERTTADFWDFMYYSFTIAMCYQTSDVTVTSTRIRRVTLVHAIFSFLFVSAIIGFVVNVISNVT